MADHKTGVAVGMPAHLARGTHDQGCASLIPFLGLPLRITNELSTATGAFPAGVLRIDPAGDDTGLVPRLVLAIAEDAPFHPESPLMVAPVAIPAFLRFQIAEVVS